MTDKSGDVLHCCSCALRVRSLTRCAARAAAPQWYRISILRHYGGVWLDASVMINRPIETWVNTSDPGTLRAFLCDGSMVRPSDWPHPDCIENFAFATGPSTVLMRAWHEEFDAALSRGCATYVREACEQYSPLVLRTVQEGCEESWRDDGVVRLCAYHAFKVARTKLPDAALQVTSSDRCACADWTRAVCDYCSCCQRRCDAAKPLTNLSAPGLCQRSRLGCLRLIATAGEPNVTVAVGARVRCRTRCLYPGTSAEICGPYALFADFPDVGLLKHLDVGILSRYPLVKFTHWARSAMATGIAAEEESTVTTRLAQYTALGAQVRQASAGVRGALPVRR